MNRLVVRLVVSHVLVALVGAVTTFVLVRSLAPQLFDRQMQGGPGGTAGPGRVLRDQFASAVDSALAVGVLVGLAAGAAFGVLAAVRLLRPLAALGAATRAIARGHYTVEVPRPGTRELDSLAQDVARLGRDLDETEARRTRLLGEVAHEMRTPLTVVDGYVEGMIDGVLPADASTLSQLTVETRRLRRLAEDLSALSRAEEGRLDLDLTPVDLGHVVEAAAERLRPQADDAAVTLVVAATAEVPVVVDVDRIAQVVTNLVGNALRATPQGGTIRVEVTAAHGTALATVSDTGEGLDADDLDRVFERFYRVPGGRMEGSPHPGPTSGSGIGLTISRRIVEAHGGTLAAASPGRGLGATFTLALPLRDGPG